MGGSSSKKSFFDKPKEFQSVGLGVELFWHHHGREWETFWTYSCFSERWYLTISQSSANTPREFIYQAVFAHKHQKGRKKLVLRGVGKLKGAYLEHRIYHDGDMSDYDQMSFQAIAHVLLDGKIRMFNFYDGIFGDPKVFDIDELAVPVMAVTKRAPFLAIDIEKGKLSQKQKIHMNEFFQILHGVQIQLKDKNLKKILKLAAKYKVFNVKRYCEHQLIWRDDFEFSEKHKFKMAWKYSLNILMNQVLRNVKTMKKLAKLASIANDMYSLDRNVSKLLIAKMYELS